MDFKFKGIGWVGGIYEKFETLCHEVDNIVKQDTVKYVENQAQSAGKSMKRFYSDVIRDVLPSLKHEGQGLALKRSITFDTNVKSQASIEEDHIDSVSKLSHVEHVSVDQIEKQLGHASNECCDLDKLSTSTSVDSLKGAEPDIMSGHVSDVSKNISSYLKIEENAIMEKTSASEVQLDHASNESCDLDKLSTSTSVDSLKGAGPDIMSGHVSDVSKNTNSDLKIEENAITEKTLASEVQELISPKEEESCGASLVNEFIDCDDKDSCEVVDEVPLTMPVHDVEFQSHQKEGTLNYNIAVEVVKKQVDCAFSELCLVDQLGNPNSVDSLLGAENISSQQVDDVLKDTKPEVDIEENATMENPSASELPEFISPSEKELFATSLLSEYIDCNDEKPYQVESKVSPATSVHDMTNTSGSNVLKFITSGEEESFGASFVHELANCYDKNLCVVQTDVSPATLDHRDQNVKDFADGSVCLFDASGGITSSRTTPSNIVEVGVDSSCGSVSKGYDLPENLPAKALLYHDPIDVAELASHNLDSSPMLTPLLPSEMKFMGAVSTSSSNDLFTESIETDAPRTVNSTEPLTGISGNKNVYFGSESAQFQALSSSDIGHIYDASEDISISSMETIDLCDEVKLEDSCVIVDSTSLYAASRIMKKHRSYKKRIQDALTSKKRLAKEYEQLAIWFGDADMGSNPDHFQTLRPSSSSTASECKNKQTEHPCDSEWELL
ncbi:hypothetical protein PTKIN_Ptkin14bG0158800 [Pterospermum kingtungense]